MDLNEKAAILSKLTPEQVQVTQACGTEPPFKNQYWNLKDEGIYVDIVSGEPLFSSKDKYDSGSGWPSFDRPIESELIVKKSDLTLGVPRVEVRSLIGDSHLGHVFPDGPRTTGQRFCINSASLRFIPKKDLIQKGYAQYLPIFDPTIDVVVVAGGCFWGVQDLIRKIPGIIQTRVGYTGGESKKPQYDSVKKGNTGHAEAVQIVFDTKKITLETLLRDHFFRLHDPTTLNKQGNDVGTQYRSAIFVRNNQQREIATEVIRKGQSAGLWKKPWVTQVVDAEMFWLAEDFHQDYLVKNPEGYTCHFYR